MTISVLASGMVTAVGFNSRASCAAIRAGLRNVRETNLWDASSGEYVAAGRVELPHWWIGTGKLAELVAPAIHECLAEAPMPLQEIPLLLCLPSAARPHRFSGLDETILDELSYRLDAPLHPLSAIVARDQPSVAASLARAQDFIARGDAPCCIVAGVDSLIDQPLVEHFLAQRRILTSKNSNGFSPGEAGSAVLIGRASSSTRGRLEILGLGVSQESATIESEEPLHGEGLTAAIRNALAASGLGIHDVQYRITDLNGEHYKFKEMVLAVLRLDRKQRSKLFDLWHPIEYIGDVGAAIGPIVLGVALSAGRKKYGPGPTVLCTFGSDAGERAAMVVTYQEAR